MQITATALPEVLLLEPKVFGDERGFFFESWNQRAFNAAAGGEIEFVQDNHSRSRQGILRGLHFQRPPHAQGKLVRVVAGSVFDVAVDIRRESPTYGRWVGYELSATNHRQLWIPPGFAHGFLVLSATAEILYKCTREYDPAAEAGIIWNDPALGIPWPVVDPVLSEKDKANPPLKDADVEG